MNQQLNRRTRELITEARGHWNYGDFNMPNSIEFQEEDVAKLVELIVRECAQVADERPDVLVDNSTAGLILQHFGLK